PPSAEDVEVLGCEGSASPSSRLALFDGENRSMLCGRATKWPASAVSRMTMPSAAAVAAWVCEWDGNCTVAVLMVLVFVSSSNGIGMTVEGGSCVGYLVKFVFVSVASIASDMLDLSDNSISATATRVDWDGSEGRFLASVVDIAAVLRGSDELGWLLLIP